MLVRPSDIVLEGHNHKGDDPLGLSISNGLVGLVCSPDKLHRSLGEIKQGVTTHFYSHGTFNSVRLLLHILAQTGPAHVMMSTYSISEKSVHQLLRHHESGLIRSIRFLIDHRVKSMSPKPFQALLGSFPGMVKTMPVHAKITTIESDDWTVSIISSMNATDNNKMERGVICTDREVFDFDKKALLCQFNLNN
jgi:hypothetical protein